MTIHEYNASDKTKGLKFGYTTGTCATAAAKAAFFLLWKKEAEAVRVSLPANIDLTIPIEEVKFGEDAVLCFVRKYSGDDPDITDGMLIGALVELIQEKCQQSKGDKLDLCCGQKIFWGRFSVDNLEELEVRDENNPDEPMQWMELFGGEGIGVVTQAGLQVGIGKPAINPVPVRMILEHIQKSAKELDCRENIRITIFAPEGRERAKKTLNTRLGIQGGISILGTSGLVMPMSSRALIETIETDMRFHLEKSDTIIAVPGMYGLSFLSGHYGIMSDSLVEFSNYIGETIDIAVRLGVKKLLLCGHIGKFVKLAGGIMNTHSNEADARLELLAAHWMRVCDPKENALQCILLAKKILNCLTTEEAIKILKESGGLTQVMGSLGESMLFFVKQRAMKAQSFYIKKKDEELNMQIGILSYTLEEGELICAGDVHEILESFTQCNMNTIEFL